MSNTFTGFLVALISRLFWLSVCICTWLDKQIGDRACVTLPKILAAAFVRGIQRATITVKTFIDTGIDVPFSFLNFLLNCA